MDFWGGFILFYPDWSDDIILFPQVVDILPHTLG